MIANLLLAAGKSTRMGSRDKLLEPINDTPLLRLIAQRALTVGPTFVTLPSVDHPRSVVIPKAAQIVVVNSDLGMSESLKGGIAALPDFFSGVVVLLGDMPDITVEDIAAIHHVALNTGAPCVRATTQNNASGHPTYFAAHLFARFSGLSGDKGASDLIKDLGNKTLFVPLADNRARLDLNTPQDWETYRCETSSDTE
jgi:molybdenum cofactor cytidylyltransferase